MVRRRSLLAGLLAVVSAQVATSAVSVKTGSVKAPDGVKIVYDVRGKGSPTLLFVHCWSCDRTFWREQVDVFAARYRVVTLDLAGHGESGHDRKNISVLGLAGDVKAVADVLKLKRIILVGHSMGGPVALEAARQLAGRVIGIIAVDTLQNAERPIPKQAIDQISGQLAADFKGTMTGFITSMFPDTRNPRARDYVIQRAVAADPAVAVPLMRDFNNLDMKALFGAAGVPVRAIDAKGPTAQPVAIEVNRKYGNFDAVTMEGVGHFLQMENAEEFNRKMQGWIDALVK
jgi:pimeloyl-ACP methyl ester carboxylesterase